MNAAPVFIELAAREPSSDVPRLTSSSDEKKSSRITAGGFSNPS